VQQAGAAVAAVKNEAESKSAVASWPLLLIVAGYALLALVYNFYTPPYEGPDEPQHFAYVLWLAQRNEFPPQGDAAWDTPVEQEASQPPFYYLLASIPARLVDLDNPPATFRPNPNFMGPFPRDFPDNDNHAIHYPGEHPQLQGGWLAFYGARLITTLFGVLLLVSVHGLARELWPAARHMALLPTLLVASIPQVLFLGSVVSNDIPVAALSTLALWRLAVLVRGQRSARQAFFAGVAFGLAALTKVSAGVLAVPALLALLWLWQSRQQTRGELLRTLFWLGAGAFLVAGWWFIRSWILYGSPLGLETHDATPWAIANPEELDKGWRRWWEVFRSFWIWLGWGTVRPPFITYHILFIFTLLATAGLALRLPGALRALRARQLAPRTIVLVILVIALLVIAVFLEVWMRRVTAPYGRLLYPAIVAVAVLLILGWSALHRWLPLLPIGFLLLLALVAPFAIIQPAYAAPSGLSPAEVSALQPDLNLRFGASPEEAFAELIAVEPLQRSVPAGTMAPIRVCWRTLGPAPADYSVLVQIVGPQNALVGTRWTYPGLGTYPTSQWEAGLVFCDLVQISTDSQLQRTLVYNVEIGMIDHESEQRVPIFDPSGAPWEVAFVDRLRVEAANVQEVAVDPAGPPLQLVRDEVQTVEWQPGETYELTLGWAANAPVSTDYKVFVHLRHPESGEPVAQADGNPLGGWYPTSWWPVGQLITDQRTFPLPQEVPPGSYHLVVGLYDLTTGQRLGAEYDIAEIEVTAEP
jgi:4-amino-4-deoxy-L-arabinose transferase-like glycosyltransferase